MLESWQDVFSSDTARDEAGKSLGETHPLLRLGLHRGLLQAAVGRCLGRGSKEAPVTSLGKLFFLATGKFTYKCRKKKKTQTFQDSSKLTAVFQQGETKDILKKGNVFY